MTGGGERSGQVVPGLPMDGQGTLPTGHPDVDATLAGLAGVDVLPPAEQVERYAEVHRSLQQTLRTIDTA